MDAFTSFLVFCQSLGALIGATTALWSELSYARAMRDHKIDIAERQHLHIIAHGLRYGMTLLLLSSLGLVVVAYLSGSTPQPALTSSYWTLIALALLIVSVSRARSRQRIPFPLGSATLFTAWWFLVYLSFGWLSLSFGAAVMSFLVVTVVFYAVLHYARLIAANI